MSTHKELLAQAQALFEEAARLKAQERAGVIAEIKATMREHGIDIRMLGNSSQPVQRPVRVKFRGPDGQEWSGRGIAPRWIRSLEDAGRTRAEFAV